MYSPRKLIITLIEKKRELRVLRLDTFISRKKYLNIFTVIVHKLKRIDQGSETQRTNFRLRTNNPNIDRIFD